MLFSAFTFLRLNLRVTLRGCSQFCSLSLGEGAGGEVKPDNDLKALTGQQ